MEERVLSWVEAIGKKESLPITAKEEMEYIKNAAKLFSNPYLFADFVPEKVEVIILDIAGEVQSMLFSESIPQDLKDKFIDSCQVLFDKRFKLYKEEKKGCALFWKTLIASSFDRVLTTEQNQMKERISRTLKQIMQIDNPICQKSAQEGLYCLKESV